MQSNIIATEKNNANNSILLKLLIPISGFSIKRASLCCLATFFACVCRIHSRNDSEKTQQKSSVEGREEEQQQQQGNNDGSVPSSIKWRQLLARKLDSNNTHSTHTHTHTER